MTTRPSAPWLQVDGVVPLDGKKAVYGHEEDYDYYEGKWNDEEYDD